MEKKAEITLIKFKGNLPKKKKEGRKKKGDHLKGDLKEWLKG